MVKNKNLVITHYPTFKNHSQFKSMEFEVFINSKYFSKFENFKHLLPHVNGV
jgi:hypothetical protein